ncbi:MAG: hypothetical protein AAF502_07055 [Bacteroidota bacterium]
MKSPFKHVFIFALAVSFLISFFSFPFNGCTQPNQKETENTETNAISENEIIFSVINYYHQGFVSNDPALTRSTIGDQLIMINGNFSGNPVDWQAHQYLNTTEVDQWIEFMINEAGPFENKLILKNINIRNNSALAVTEEIGKNKFRNWEGEEKTYMLGKIEGDWKIVGLFIKDIKNPE